MELSLPETAGGNHLKPMSRQNTRFCSFAHTWAALRAHLMLPRAHGEDTKTSAISQKKMPGGWGQRGQVAPGHGASEGQCGVCLRARARGLLGGFQTPPRLPSTRLSDARRA